MRARVRSCRGARLVAAAAGLACLGQSKGRCDSAPPAATAPAAESIVAAGDTGETFQLTRSVRDGMAESEEYIPVGETIEQWTQLVTIQRVPLSCPTAPGEFVAQLQRRVRQQGAAFDVLQQGPAGVVFAVRFSAAPEQEEQVVLGLALGVADEPLRLTVVQYALKPLRAPLPVVEQRLRSWRAKLARQASQLPAEQ